MQAFSSSFKDYDVSLAFHVRVWQLELVDTEDRIVKISGLMFGKSTFRSLSEFMREKLGRNDLLLFDGNYDPIDRIEAVIIASLAEHHGFEPDRRGVRCLS